MKNFVAIFVVLALVIAAGTIFTYSAKTRAFFKDAEIKTAIALKETYDTCAKASPTARIDPRDFAQLLVTNSSLPSDQEPQAIRIAITEQLVPLGSHDILCVVAYRERTFVGVRGNGDRVFMSRDQFRFWRQESAAVFVPSQKSSGSTR